MLQGERLDQIRDLAWRELELAEDEEVLSDAVSDVVRPMELVRDRRPSVPITAITAEHEVPAA